MAENATKRLQKSTQWSLLTHIIVFCLSLIVVGSGFIVYKYTFLAPLAAYSIPYLGWSSAILTLMGTYILLFEYTSIVTLTVYMCLLSANLLFLIATTLVAFSMSTEEITHRTESYWSCTMSEEARSAYENKVNVFQEEAVKAKAIQEIFSFALILFTALMMALLVFQRRILVQWGVDPVLGERRDEIRARPRSSSREPFALSRSSNEQAMELSSLWRFNRIDVSDLPCPAAFSASHVYSSSSSSNERGGADRNTKTSTTTTKTCVNKRTDDGHERSQNKLSSYLSSLTGHGHGRHLKGSRETDAHVKTHQGTQGKSRGTFRSNTFHFSKSRKTSSSLHDLESILNLSSTPRPKDYLLLGAHRLSQSKGHFQNKRPRYPGRKRYVRQDRSRSTPHNIAITGHTQLQPQEHVKTPVNTTNTKSMDADTDANAESAHTNSAAHSSNLVDLSDNDTNTCLLPSPTGAPVLVNLNVTENHDEHNSQ